MMKIINLTYGEVTKVSDCDYGLLSQNKWVLFKSRNKKYAGTYNKGKLILMHNVIMNPSPGKEIDHADNDGLNNQRENLREGTHSQNLMNQLPHKGRRFKGVSKFRTGFRAYLKKEQKFYSLGVYKTEEEAARAYDEGAKKYFGKYANLNFK